MKHVFLLMAMALMTAVPTMGATQGGIVSIQNSNVLTTDSLVLDSITGTATITFPTNKTNVFSGFNNNNIELERISKELLTIKNNPDFMLRGLTIHGYSSIDGPYLFNEQIARQRADSLAAFVSRLTDLPDGIISTHYTAEDWQNFRLLVENAPAEQLPHRNEILRIIDGNREPDTKEWLIKTTYPTDYSYLIDTCMPQLRRSDYTINYIRMNRIQTKQEPSTPETTVAPSVIATDTVESVATVTVERQKRTICYLRTNLLLPLLNVGIEMPIGNRWSVGADWYYPWAFRSSNHKNCFQIDGLALEGRYWFGEKHESGEENKPYRLQGHSVGAFAMAGRYDLERNYSGHQGEYIMGGVDYLYAMPIFKKRMHLEFSLGVGYLYTKATPYDVYELGGKGYRDKYYRKKINYVGPLRASIALVIPIKLTKTVTEKR